MISTRLLSVANAAIAVWLVMFMAVPAARAQNHTPAPAAAPSRPADEHLGPIVHWHMEKKTDALSDESSIQPTGLKFVAGANGKLEGLVRATAYCSRNGVSVFFLADVSNGDPKPGFPWYSDDSRGDDEQISDVRLRVDDRPVHVAQGFPDVEGHQVYTNTLGLLFYEPHTAERAVNDQRERVATGVPGSGRDW